MQDEDDAILAIINGQRHPDPVAYRQGQGAHAAGHGYHQSPHPFHSMLGLSWRIGWNDRALQQRPPVPTNEE